MGQLFFWILAFGRTGAGVWGPLKEDFLIQAVEGRTDADIRYKNRN